MKKKNTLPRLFLPWRRRHVRLPFRAKQRKSSQHRHNRIPCKPILCKLRRLRRPRRLSAPATTAAAVTVTPVTTAPVTVPADQRKIYIDTSGLKNDTTQPFCHIYGDESEFYSWGSKKEYCTLVSGSIYSYDLNPLALKDDAVYHVAFGTVGGSITEDLEFTTADYGATMLVEVNPIYADHDPYKNKYLAKWK